jgi:hypothetical protein
VQGVSAWDVATLEAYILDVHASVYVTNVCGFDQYMDNHIACGRLQPKASRASRQGTRPLTLGVRLGLSLSALARTCYRYNVNKQSADTRDLKTIADALEGAGHKIHWWASKGSGYGESQYRLVVRIVLTLLSGRWPLAWRGAVPVRSTPSLMLNDIAPSCGISVARHSCLLARPDWLDRRLLRRL